ncbi:MAG: hypothetical protein EOO60_06070 [Hymenobacter sp.]|nr:MAG: hypothetical protein EOO60_06070 [Hymenobacter sp.]
MTRLLELYLLKQASKKLPISNYLLIGLMPISPDYSSDYQTLLLSPPATSMISRWDMTYDLLTFLQKGLSQEQYQEIYNINLLEPESTAVQRLKNWEPSREDDVFPVPISIIGGVTPQYITIIRSSVLQHLNYHQPLKVYLVNGEIIDGKLIAIEEYVDDSILRFESVEGERTCSFLDIAKVRS